MPSSFPSRYAGMQDPRQLIYPPSYRADDIIISTMSINCVGRELDSFGAAYQSAAWPTANKTLGLPLILLEPFLVLKVFWMNGTTAGTDSHDVGIFSESGTTKHVSAGATLSVGANILQEVDVTDTLLQPGRYWMAMVSSGVTATPFLVNTGNSNYVHQVACGGTAGTAGALPATLSPARVAATVSNLIPWCGISSRTQVA